MNKRTKTLIKWTIGAGVLAVVSILYPDKAEIVARALLLFFTGI